MPGHMHSKVLWFAGAFVVVLFIGVFIGVQLAHSNSDYVCSQGYSDTQQSACTGGSWSDWTVVNGVEQRTYTGTKSVVSYSGSVTGLSCSHPPKTTIAQSTGTTTIAYAACQIVQTGTGGASGSGSSTSTITVTSQSETTGTLSGSTEVTGSYSDYQHALDASLATSTLQVVPSVLKAGNTTQVLWSASHVVSCKVTGSNGDSWTGLSSPAQGGISSPITSQTTYTLQCTTALGNTIGSTAIVNIVPAFNEQ